MPPQHEATAGAELNRQPIGAGPYMLEEWNPDGNMVLVRNPHYWDRKAQHFDKIVVKFIPDINSRYAAVQNGDVDLTYVTHEQVRDARKNPKLQVIRQAATGSFTVQFNLKAPPLDDVRVRQALAHAVDRNADRDVVFAGEVEMANSFWSPPSPFACAVDYPSYDPGKARALLKDYGKPVKFTLRTPTSPIAVLAAELYQSYWKKVGIEAEILPVQNGPAYIGPVFAGNYEAALWDVPDLVDPDVQVYAPYHSKSGANITHADNAVFDAALERGRNSLDLEVRQQAYCDFSREFAKYLPVLLRDQHIYYAVANARLRGITHLRFGRFWPAAAWWEP
jgi:peptide/nickel transport system substrate-binding protein